MRGFWLAILTTFSLSLAQGLLLESDLVQTFELRPGEEARGAVRLRNAGKTPLTVSLSLGDYREGEGFMGLGEAPRSLGPQGIALETDRVTLLPGESRDVGFRVRFPAGLSGTRYAAILVAPEAEAREEPGEGARVGLRVVQRYAVLVLASYGGEAQVVFTVGQGGEGRSSLEAENLGGSRFYYPRVGYQVVGPGGVVAQGELGTFLFLPGEPKRLSLALPPLSPGEYQAVLFLDDGYKAYAVRAPFSLR
ncbi:MAG: hypothetical protein ABDH20_11565 [Thermus sp.]